MFGTCVVGLMLAILGGLYLIAWSNARTWNTKYWQLNKSYNKTLQILNKLQALSAESERLQHAESKQLIDRVIDLEAALRKMLAEADCAQFVLKGAAEVEKNEPAERSTIFR